MGTLFGISLIGILICIFTQKIAVILDFKKFLCSTNMYTNHYFLSNAIWFFLLSLRRKKQNKLYWMLWLWNMLGIKNRVENYPGCHESKCSVLFFQSFPHFVSGRSANGCCLLTGSRLLFWKTNKKTNQLPCLVQVPAVWNLEERIFAQHLFLTAATSSPLNLCRSVSHFQPHHGGLLSYLNCLLKYFYHCGWLRFPKLRVTYISL